MLVSAIMPTYNRRHLIPMALACYLAQDWEEKELIVVDDGSDPIGDLLGKVRAESSVYYLKPKVRMAIGAKRNLCCERASGQIIAHWDDDDWSASGRITDQVTRLIDSGKQMSGYHSILFWHLEKKKAYKYVSQNPNYSSGSALCYRKTFWQANHFPPLQYAEDNAFVDAARNRNGLISVDAGQMMVVRAHAGCTKNVDGVSNATRVGAADQWKEVPKESLPADFFAALGTSAG